MRNIHSIQYDSIKNEEYNKRYLPIFCPTCVEKGLLTPKSDIFSEHGEPASLTAAFSAVHSHSHTYIRIRETCPIIADRNDNWRTLTTCQFCIRLIDRII